MTIVARSIAAALVVACVGMLTFAVVSLALPGTEVMRDRPTPLTSAGMVTIILAFAGVGLLVAWKRPANPVGWLFLVGSLSLAGGAFATEYVGRVLYVDAALPGAALVGWVGQWIWGVGMMICMPLAIMLFPDGRFPSKLWRRVTVLAVGVASVVLLAIAVTPGEMWSGRFTNPFGAPGALGEIAQGVNTTASAAVLLPGLTTAAATSVRFLRARGALRLQMKWLTYPVGLFFIGVAAGIATELEWVWTLALVALAAVPIAVAVAILRYRLYDIDIIIRRTLVYGALTVTLGAVYAGSVLVLQATLSPVTQGDGLAIAVSTLAVWALFQPVRRRIQRAVDRRFYRSRYDSRRTLESFGARLRQEVDLDRLAAELGDVVGETVQPASVSVWLRRP